MIIILMAINTNLIGTAALYALLGMIAFLLTPLILWGSTSLFIMLLIATEIVCATGVVVWMGTWMNVPYWSKIGLVLAAVITGLLCFLLPFGYALWTGVLIAAWLIECFGLYCQYMIDTGRG